MIHNLSFTPQKNSPTVVPKSLFLVNEDAITLKRAMKGPETNEKTIINIFTKRSLSQRLQIVSQYKNLHNGDLTEELKNGLSGNFRNVVVALVTPAGQFYAEELHEAMRGFGTDENVLIEVLCTLKNSEIVAVKRAYQQKYRTSLQKDLAGDTSGYFKSLLISLCSAQRNETNFTNPTQAKAVALSLFNAGENRWGTDESTFNRILCFESYAQLRLIFQEYENLTGHPLEQAIEGEFSGNGKSGLLTIVECVKNKASFFARQIRKSVKGLGTDNRDLIRLVVMRCETDMGDIKREYESQYGESLAGAIKGDCSGNYAKCLLGLIGEAEM